MLDDVVFVAVEEAVDVPLGLLLFEAVELIERRVLVFVEAEFARDRLEPVPSVVEVVVCPRGVEEVGTRRRPELETDGAPPTVDLWTLELLELGAPITNCTWM